MKADIQRDVLALIRDAEAEEARPSAAHRARLKHAVLARLESGEAERQAREPKSRLARRAPRATAIRTLVGQTAAFLGWGAGLGLAFAGVVEGHSIASRFVSEPASAPARSALPASRPAPRRGPPIPRATETSLPTEDVGKPSAGHAAEPTAGHAAEPTAGHAAEPTAGHAAEPTAGHAAEPMANTSAERMPKTPPPSTRTEPRPDRLPTAAPESLPAPTAPNHDRQGGSSIAGPDLPLAIAPDIPGPTSAMRFGTSPSPLDPQLGQELALMREAQAALRDRSATKALRLVQEYDHRFGVGQLRRERLAAEVFAACQLGDTALARRAAQEFLALDTTSPLARRVQAACPFSQTNPDPDFRSRSRAPGTTQ